MKKIFGIRISRIIILALLLPAFILFIAILINPEHFLGGSHRVKANVLLVEGWLTQETLEMANQELNDTGYKLIITTGIISKNLEYCRIPMNGYLIFNTKKFTNNSSGISKHSFGINARSEAGGIYLAHFKFYVNDSLINEYTTSKESVIYKAEWTGDLRNVDSVVVRFDNDLSDGKGDRNLYVKEILIDDSIRIPYQFNSVYDIGLPDGKDIEINNFYSNAELARNRLISMGIDSSRIIAVPANKVVFNRTLTSALAFRSWLKQNNTGITGINILSEGVHARRTWMTYKHILRKTTNVGIISLHENEVVSGHNHGIKAVLYEIAGLIYYSIVLLPY